MLVHVPRSHALHSGDRGLTVFRFFRRLTWRDTLPAIAQHLARIEDKADVIMSSLDDIKANQTKERALVEKLLGLIQAATVGTFNPDQHAEIDAIVADQTATLGEDPTPV